MSAVAEGTNPIPEAAISTLPSPCAPACGNGMCEGAECCSCYADCTASPTCVGLDCNWCGDGACAQDADPDECSEGNDCDTCASCPIDCGAC